MVVLLVLIVEMNSAHGFMTNTGLARSAAVGLDARRPPRFAPNGAELLPRVWAAAGLQQRRATGPAAWLLSATEPVNDATGLRAWTGGNDVHRRVVPIANRRNSSSGAGTPRGTPGSQLNTCYSFSMFHRRKWRR